MREQDCKHPPGKFHPSVDFNRCEGKGLCADVCPHDVFVIRKIDFDDYRRLGFLPRMKNRVHGGIVAYAPNADRCQACGACIQACPEDAIKLVKASSAQART